MQNRRQTSILTSSCVIHGHQKRSIRSALIDSGISTANEITLREVAWIGSCEGGPKKESEATKGPFFVIEEEVQPMWLNGQFEMLTMESRLRSREKVLVSRAHLMRLRHHPTSIVDATMIAPKSWTSRDVYCFTPFEMPSQLAHP